MLREIKFRDFCFDTNKMRYFDLDHYDKNEHDCFGTIMQFTGLVDKNGVEIYENDLISDGHHIGKVFYNSDSAQFQVDFSPYDDSPQEMSGGEICWMTVAGNIHEHKHLL